MYRYAMCWIHYSNQLMNHREWQGFLLVLENEEMIKNIKKRRWHVRWSPSRASRFPPGTRVSSPTKTTQHNYWCQQAWLIEVVCTCSKINEVWMKIDENTSPRAIYCAIRIEISIKFKSLSGCSTGFQGSIQGSKSRLKLWL